MNLRADFLRVIKVSEIKDIEEDLDVISGSVANYAVFGIKGISVLYYFDVQKSDKEPAKSINLGADITELRTAAHSLLAFTSDSKVF